MYRRGKKLEGRSKWYKLQPIPGIKVSKEQSHLFMDWSTARRTGYEVPLFKQGIHPISCSSPLWQIHREFDSSSPFLLLSPPFPVAVPRDASLSCYLKFHFLFASTRREQERCQPILDIIFHSLSRVCWLRGRVFILTSICCTVCKW